MPKPLPPPNRSLVALLWREVTALFTVLTDLSFKQFVTPRIARTLYSLSLIGAVLASAAWVCEGFAVGVMRGLFTLVTVPVAFFVYILTARVALELMLAVFRIAENTEKLREKSDRRDP